MYKYLSLLQSTSWRVPFGWLEIAPIEGGQHELRLRNLACHQMVLGEIWFWANLWLSGTGIAPDLTTGHSGCALERLAERLGLEPESCNLVGLHCGPYLDGDRKEQEKESIKTSFQNVATNTVAENWVCRWVYQIFRLLSRRHLRNMFRYSRQCPWRSWVSVGKERGPLRGGMPPAALKYWGSGPV